jgi:exopolyphosphatase/pppGpp-phosphohydrolase
MSTRNSHRSQLGSCGITGGVLEFGAHSLKFHRLEDGYIRTVKYPYGLGHEVYGTGSISKATVGAIVNVLRTSDFQPAIAIATSAVREAQNATLLTRRLKNEFNLRVFILSCYEEASLLARGYLARSRKLPSMIADIGGGGVQIVYLTRSRNTVWDSLPLGAIHLYQRWKMAGLTAMSEWIDYVLEKATIVTAGEINATGGTAKAIAKTLGRTTLGYGEVAELEARVRREGPPLALKPERARVFFPGLILVRKLLEFVRANSLNYLSVSVGRQVLQESIGTEIFSPNSSGYLDLVGSRGNHN